MKEYMNVNMNENMKENMNENAIKICKQQIM